MEPSDTLLGLYCHVPFCASTCDFCAFYQEKPRRGDLDLYLEAMDREFELLPKDRVIETVFWGGGTPGLLAVEDLERLGASMLEHLVELPREWTVEMAPSTVKADKLEVLRDLGVTRVSMGVQSFDPNLLESLGRLHNPKQIYAGWDRLVASGIPQTNLDLIFAIPNQTLEQWKQAMDEAARLGPDHISTYCLTFEEDTALWVKLSEGKVKIDVDREVEFYEFGWKHLPELGYQQYEVSNFSKPGKECLHNINTWRMREWIGCGPSAASQYQGQRYQRPANLVEWCDGMLSGEPIKEDVVLLDEATLLADSLLFGLRMNAGVNLDELSRKYPNSSGLGQFERLLLQLENECLLERGGDQVRLTDRGRLLADSVGSQILKLAV